MKRLLEVYLPSLAITFTAVVLCTSAFDLMEGYEALSNWWILQLFGCIAVVEVMDALLGRIEFRSYRGYFLTEAVIAYGWVLIFGYLGKWFPFTGGTLLYITVMFVLIFSGVHVYFCRRAKSNADEINRMLQEKE